MARQPKVWNAQLDTVGTLFSEERGTEVVFLAETIQEDAQKGRPLYVLLTAPEARQYAQRILRNCDRVEGVQRKRVQRTKRVKNG